MGRGRRWPTVLAGLASALVLAVAFAAVFTDVKKAELQGNITVADIATQFDAPRASAAPIQDAATGDYRPLTVVLLGSDTREGKGNGGFGSASQIGGARSDTTIVLHISADRKRALAVSIPRDTLITLPKCKKDGKSTGGYQGLFNQAIELGGPGCTIKAIEEMSGLTIDNFMMVDFGGFKRIIDALGGVEICLSTDVNDEKSGLNLSKGKHVVTGEEALAFVRARKTLGDGSDTSRIRRQQAFLSSVARKVLSGGTLLNPATVNGLLVEASKSLTADPQMANVDNLQELALSMVDLRPEDITFTTLPWVPAGDGAHVLVNTKRAAPIWQAIADDTPWPAKGQADQPLLKTPPENISVRVLNGTSTPGAAKRAARQLENQGFRIAEVGNAERTDYTETTVLFDPRWDVSARTLIAATGAASEKAPKQGGVMTLIVGPDFAGVQEVKIAKVATDITANVNTADENFCAS